MKIYILDYYQLDAENYKISCTLLLQKEKIQLLMLSLFFYEINILVTLLYTY